MDLTQVNWSLFKTFIFYLGMFDAGVVLLGGLAIAFYLIIDLKTIRGSLIPAMLIIVVTNLWAVITVIATRWLAG